MAASGRVGSSSHRGEVCRTSALRAAHAGADACDHASRATLASCSMVSHETSAPSRLGDISRESSEVRGSRSDTSRHGGWVLGFGQEGEHQVFPLARAPPTRWSSA